MINHKDSNFSKRKQCTLLGVNRSGTYYKAVPISEETLAMINLLDSKHTKTPSYGVPRMTEYLNRKGFAVGRDKVRSMLRSMGLEAIYPKPRLSIPNTEHKIYPYLLKDKKVTTVNQVWCADITYIRLDHGFAYLVAIMDWHSRYVLSWRICNSLEADFCVEALEEALKYGRPEIFNTDQGCQFTSFAFTSALKENNIKISMDGKGKVFDNIFIERLWRTLKYENIYIKDYRNIPELKAGLEEYFEEYNTDRYHQSLGYKTPWEVYGGMMAEELSTKMNLSTKKEKKKQKKKEKATTAIS